jgi:hypothetical protein
MKSVTLESIVKLIKESFRGKSGFGTGTGKYFTKQDVGDILVDGEKATKNALNALEYFNNWYFSSENAGDEDNKKSSDFSLFPKQDENNKIVAPFVTSKIENTPDRFNSVTRQYQFENPKNGLNLVVYLTHFFRVIPMSTFNAKQSTSGGMEGDDNARHGEALRLAISNIDKNEQTIRAMINWNVLNKTSETKRTFEAPDGTFPEFYKRPDNFPIKDKRFFTKEGMDSIGSKIRVAIDKSEIPVDLSRGTMFDIKKRSPEFYMWCKSNDPDVYELITQLDNYQAQSDEQKEHSDLYWNFILIGKGQRLSNDLLSQRDEAYQNPPEIAYDTLQVDVLFSTPKLSEDIKKEIETDENAVVKSFIRPRFGVPDLKPIDRPAQIPEGGPYHIHYQCKDILLNDSSFTRMSGTISLSFDEIFGDLVKSMEAKSSWYKKPALEKSPSEESTSPEYEVFLKKIPYIDKKVPTSDAVEQSTELSCYDALKEINEYYQDQIKRQLLVRGTEPKDDEGEALVTKKKVEVDENAVNEFYTRISKWLEVYTHSLVASYEKFIDDIVVDSDPYKNEEKKLIESGLEKDSDKLKKKLEEFKIKPTADLRQNLYPFESYEPTKSGGLDLKGSRVNIVRWLRNAYLHSKDAENVDLPFVKMSESRGRSILKILSNGINTFMADGMDVKKEAARVKTETIAQTYSDSLLSDLITNQYVVPKQIDPKYHSQLSPKWILYSPVYTTGGPDRIEIPDSSGENVPLIFANHLVGKNQIMVFKKTVPETYTGDYDDDLILGNNNKLLTELYSGMFDNAKKDQMEGRIERISKKGKAIFDGYDSNKSSESTGTTKKSEASRVIRDALMYRLKTRASYIMRKSICDQVKFIEKREIQDTDPDGNPSTTIYLAIALTKNESSSTLNSKTKESMIPIDAVTYDLEKDGLDIDAETISEYAKDHENDGLDYQKHVSFATNVDNESMIKATSVPRTYSVFMDRSPIYREENIEHALMAHAINAGNQAFWNKMKKRIESRPDLKPTYNEVFYQPYVGMSQRDVIDHDAETPSETETSQKKSDRVGLYDYEYSLGIGKRSENNPKLLDNPKHIGVAATDTLTVVGMRIYARF